MSKATRVLVVSLLAACSVAHAVKSTDASGKGPPKAQNVPGDASRWPTRNQGVAISGHDYPVRR